MQIASQELKMPERPDMLRDARSFRSLLWFPRFAADPQAMLHVPLLFWLTGAVMPARAGVFGVGQGAAFFALCQAMDKHDSGGRCMGFGHWPGSGAQPVPSAIADHAARFYPDLADLTSCALGADMSATLRDASLDLLLVDLREDLATDDAAVEGWLRVLRQGGLLIVHGTHQHRGATTGSRLETLLNGGPALHCDTGAGLSVLAMGDPHPRALDHLLDLAPEGYLSGEIDLLFRRLGQGLEAATARTVEAQATAQLRSDRDAAWTAKAAADTDLAHERDTRFTETAALARHLEQTKDEMIQARAQADESAAQIATAYEARSILLVQTQQALARAEADRIDPADRARYHDLQVAAQGHAAELAEHRTRTQTLSAELEEARRIAHDLRADLARERDTRFAETAALTRYLEQMNVEMIEARAQADEMAGQIAGLSARNGTLQDYQNELLSSTSWRLTGPMRRIKDLVKR